MMEFAMRDNVQAAVKGIVIIQVEYKLFNPILYGGMSLYDTPPPFGFCPLLQKSTHT